MTIKIIYTPDPEFGESVEKLELTLDSEIWDSGSFTQAINKLLAFIGYDFRIKVEGSADSAAIFETLQLTPDQIRQTVDQVFAYLNEPLRKDTPETLTKDSE